MWPLYAVSQNTSKIGRFSADVVVGCAPLTINITQLDNFGNISRQYIYEPGIPVTNSPTHTFSTPGVYNIVQVIGLDVNPKTDTLAITVHSPDLPQVTVANCRDFAASVRAPNGPYDYYRVYYTPAFSVDVPAGQYAQPYDFGAAGTYNVRVKGYYNGGNEACGEVTVAINTLQNPSQPVLNTVQTFGDGTMLLSATFNPGISYVLQVAENGGAYTELPLVFQGSQLLVNQLNPQSSNYCFRLAAYDPCNAAYYYSNVICHASLTASFQEFRNVLSWNVFGAGATSFEIIRNAAPLYQASAGQTTAYADSSLVCNTDYCYQLRVNYPGGAAISEEVCGVSFEEQNLPPVTSIYSTYQNDDLLIRWSGGRQLSNPEFRAIFSTDGTSFSTGAQFSGDVTEQLISNSQFLRNSYFYTLQYSDECDNLSPPGPLTRPVFLKAVERGPNQFDLQWNQYLPLTDGVRQYFVELWDADMNNLATMEVWDPSFFNLRLTSDYSQVAWVTVRAEGFGADAGFVSRSNRRPLAFHSDLYLPTAFTPDGDGLNDEFGVLGPEVTEFSFRIYNRWGQLVFATNEQARGWNGVFNGQRSPQGTYLYFIEGKDAGGRLIKKNGNFVLLRN